MGAYGKCKCGLTPDRGGFVLSRVVYRSILRLVSISTARKHGCRSDGLTNQNGTAGADCEYLARPV